MSVPASTIVSAWGNVNLALSISWAVTIPTAANNTAFATYLKTHMVINKEWTDHARLGACQKWGLDFRLGI